MNTTFNDTYEIKSLIGKGGMSTVYLAEHKRLHTRWAVKEVRKQQGTRFDFLAESNILKRLQHPMLPRIVNIFEDTENIYIVEDYVEGITLDNLLKREKKVDEPLALQWFRDLCGVLRYLHTQQPSIIYRDMKPANVMLQPDGSLKLIDFGIAREYKEASSGDTTYIGTKGYAAPEQFGRAQTDARTDIYALGVTMYHLVTGKSPYEPPYQFVPARELDGKLSHGIEYILNKCVQPEPADRYQDVDKLLDDLNHIYRFDKAWKRVQAVKRVRVAVIAVMLAASVGLIVAGRKVMAQERVEQYDAYLAQASGLYTSDYDGAVAALDQARALFPDLPDADRQQTYALYLNGQWQECIDFGTKALEKFGPDTQTRVSMAAAQFEFGDYEQAAEGGNQFAGYQLGKLYLQSTQVEKNPAKAVECLTDAAEQNCAQAQYLLGKLYLLGQDVEQDFAAAEYWFTQAASQGHEYAQFFLGHMEAERDPSVLLCATRLLCAMAQIIRDTPPPAPPGIHIDRKQLRQIQEKKIAMGHKPDDHEEQGWGGMIM